MLKSTKGFYFGSSEAEAEKFTGKENGFSYFKDYLGIINSLSQGRFIISGRKGSGKSAIANFLCNNLPNNHYTDIIRLPELQIEKLIQNQELKKIENIDQVLFEWIILVRLAKLLLKNSDSIHTLEYMKLGKFFERNRGITDIDKYTTEFVTESNKMELSIDTIRQGFGVLVGKYFDTKLTKAPFYKLIEPLRDICIRLLSFEVNKDKKYMIFFDDLDLIFDDAEHSIALMRIMKLIRISKTLNLSMSDTRNIQIILLLRPDFKKDLINRTTDAAKIFMSYEIEISWYDHQTYLRKPENDLPLKDLANIRIAQNFASRDLTYNEDDPWASLFSSDIGKSGKTSFKHTLDYTFYRPRDIINLLIIIGKSDYNYPINLSQYMQLMRKYSEALVEELKGELFYNLTSEEIEYTFDVLIPEICKINNSNKQPLNHQDLISYISKDLKYDKLRSEKYAKKLYEYTIIGYRSMISNSVYFSFRERDIPDAIKIDEFAVTLPKVINTRYSGYHT